MQFGDRTDNGPLTLLVDGVFEILRKIAPGGGSFVDISIFWLLFAWHGVCAGLTGECAHCLAKVIKIHLAGQGMSRKAIK
jgi:hypothetical protein